MSFTKAQLEELAKLHADLSNVFEAAAAEAEDDEPAAKPAAKGKAKAKPAAVEADDDELPPPKKAGTAGKPAAKKAKPAAVEADDEADGDAPTEEDVVAAAQALIKATDKPTALKIIKKFGGARVADLDDSVYAKVIAAFEKAMPAGDDDSADADDDI